MLNVGRFNTIRKFHVCQNIVCSRVILKMLFQIIETLENIAFRKDLILTLTLFLPLKRRVAREPLIERLEYSKMTYHSDLN